MKNKEGKMEGKQNLERANSDDQILLHFITDPNYFYLFLFTVYSNIGM
jgi:hypothetical protein